MPVCQRCFAYYVRAPCPYCADTGIGQPADAGSQSHFESKLQLTTPDKMMESKKLQRQIDSLQGKIEQIQKENQNLKGELTEKNRIISRLEADLRSSVEDRSFLLNRISELEGTKPVTIPPEQE